MTCQAQAGILMSNLWIPPKGFCWQIFFTVDIVVLSVHLCVYEHCALNVVLCFLEKWQTAAETIEVERCCLAM